MHYTRGHLIPQLQIEHVFLHPLLSDSFNPLKSSGAFEIGLELKGGSG